MENLNNVPSTGTFGGSVSKINSNFDLVVNAINSLEYQTTRSKGILNYGQNPATVFPNAVEGDWCMILSEGNVFPATIKTFNGSTWSGSGTWNPDGVDLTGYAKTTDMTTAIANSLAQATARMGYGECTVSGTTLAVSIPNFILPTSGGTIHIKMSAAGTGASTLSINGTTAKTLWYNGKAVSSTNTWEANEIISVFYDGTKYMSSNSQGGGGDAEKIKYDNSQSGLASDNVQDALDEVADDLENKIDGQSEIVSSWDFALSDANGNIVFCIKDGHVITKNFKSSALTIGVADLDKENCAYAVTDSNGNMAFVITEDGHIITKNFNSRNVSTESLAVLNKLAMLVTKFYGKHVAIVGDSISSYQGYLPTGWAWYYPHGDVTSVNKTWWYQVAESLGMTFINCAYSGSATIGDSTITQEDVENSGSVPCGCSDARITSLTRDGKTPDIILILMGINDYIRGYGIGTWNEHSAIPSEGNIGYFSQAYALMLNKMRTALPNARIFCCTLIQKSSNFPDSTNSLQDFNDTIKKIAEIFGADVINTNACGITRYNIGSYSEDGALHPNTAGHKLIADKIIAELITKY